MKYKSVINILGVSYTMTLKLIVIGHTIFTNSSYLLLLLKPSYP